MVERRMMTGRKSNGQFDKGHKFATGNKGNSESVRRTNRIITRAIFHQLCAIDDPATQRTKADKLVAAVLRRGIMEGDVGVLKAFVERLEGSPMQKVAFKDFTDQPRTPKLITKDMTPAEAGRIFQAMLKDDPDDPDDPLWIDEDEKAERAAAERKSLPPPEFVPRHSRKSEPEDEPDDIEPVDIPAETLRRSLHTSPLKADPRIAALSKSPFKQK